MRLHFPASTAAVPEPSKSTTQSYEKFWKLYEKTYKHVPPKNRKFLSLLKEHPELALKGMTPEELMNKRMYSEKYSNDEAIYLDVLPCWLHGNIPALQCVYNIIKEYYSSDGVIDPEKEFLRKSFPHVHKRTFGLFNRTCNKSHESGRGILEWAIACHYDPPLISHLLLSYKKQMQGNISDNQLAASLMILAAQYGNLKLVNDLIEKYGEDYVRSQACLYFDPGKIILYSLSLIKKYCGDKTELPAIAAIFAAGYNHVDLAHTLITQYGFPNEIFLPLAAGQLEFMLYLLKQNHGCNTTISAADKKELHCRAFKWGHSSKQ